MLALLIFIVLALLTLVVIELRERKRQNNQTSQQLSMQTVSSEQRLEGCCGEHLVCEKQTLLTTNAEIVYYDDEELDSLSGIEAEDYTDEQHAAISNVFSTLREDDVAGWCRSLQLRGINLPTDIREEALMIVRELRQNG